MYAAVNVKTQQEIKARKQRKAQTDKQALQAAKTKPLFSRKASVSIQDAKGSSNRLNKQAFSYRSFEVLSASQKATDFKSNDERWHCLAAGLVRKHKDISMASSFTESILPNIHHIRILSIEEKWQRISVGLLRNLHEAEKSVQGFSLSILNAFHDVQFYFDVTLSSEERRLYYQSFLKRATIGGTIQAADIEELLSSPAFNFDVTQQEVSEILNERLHGRNVAQHSKRDVYIDCDNDNLNLEFFLSIACELKRRKAALLDRQAIGSISNLLPLDPECGPKQTWDLVCMILLLYCSFSVPFDIAFSDSAPGGPMTVADACALAIDAVFLLDICLNFVTAVDVEGVFVREPAGIAAHYARTWFAADFAGSFPFDTVIASAVENQARAARFRFRADRC